jgi:hypothetical protein
MDPVTDPLLLRKSGIAGNRTWDLRICSQEALTSPKSGGRSVGIVRLLTQVTEFVFLTTVYNAQELLGF